MLVNYTVINQFFGQIMGEIDLGLFQIDLTAFGQIWKNLGQFHP